MLQCLLIFGRENIQVFAVYQGSYQQHIRKYEDGISSDGEILHVFFFFKCTLWMYVGHIFSWRKRHLQLPTWKFNWIRLDLGFEATSIWVQTTTYIWLVGGLEHFSFFHILGISYSQLTLFFRGGGSTTNQMTMVWLWWLDRTVPSGQSDLSQMFCCWMPTSLRFPSFPWKMSGYVEKR